MTRVVLPFPVLPGKTAEDARSIGEEFKRRPDEYAESRRRLGITCERAFLQTTPMGMFVVAYLESTGGVGETLAAMARSELAMDKYFVAAVKEFHGFDAANPPPGPEPETIGAWVDPDVTERRKGFAFCAPAIPGKEDAGRAFVQDAYNRSGMTDSRRELRQNIEVVTLIPTPDGPVIAVYVEGEDPQESNREFAASTSEFNTWFKGELRKLFPPFIDFDQPVPGVEEFFDGVPLLTRH